MNGNHEVNGDEQSLNSGTSDKKNQKQQQQELNACVTNGNSTSDQSNTNCNTKNLQTSSTESRRTGGKLGSDGESEASPETSLSPLDVDSMEGKFFYNQLFNSFKTHGMSNNNNPSILDQHLSLPHLSFLVLIQDEIYKSHHYLYQCGRHRFVTTFHSPFASL